MCWVGLCWLNTACVFEPVPSRVSPEVDGGVADTGIVPLSRDAMPVDRGFEQDIGMRVLDAGFVDTGPVDTGVIPDAGFLCGNEQIDAPEEECDDGAAADGDGCSSVCLIEPGYQCFFEPSECELIPELVVDDVELPEGEAAEVEIRLERASLGDVTFTYATEDGDAVVGDDYAERSGVTTIPAGVTSTVVEVFAQEDLRFEPAESFFVRVSEVVGATVAKGRGEVVIFDVAPLTDRGLVVRYFLDEGRQSPQPLTVIDFGPISFDLDVVRDGGGQPEFRAVGGQQAMSWSAVRNDGRALADLSANPGFRARLDQTRQVTLEVVVRFDEVANASRFIHVGNGSERGWLTLGATSDDFVVGLFGSEFIGVPIPNGTFGQRVVVTVVIDTTEFINFERLRLFVDGVRIFGADGTISRNDRLAIPSGRTLVLGNRPNGAASVRGELYYVGIYEEALSNTEVSDNVQALLVSDDGP